MKRQPRTAILIAALLLSCALAAWAFQAARQRPTPPASLTAFVPQGALLTIESPDFAKLLDQWNASPEQRAWLRSDNFSVFSNSRLFGRLNDARAEFEGARDPSTASSINSDFLTQIAGHQSVFAWYDVGALEFLYITRLPAAQADRIALLKDRRGWTPRQAGGLTFYLRTSTSAADESAHGQARTVAFAQVPDPNGDLLLLATREDLIANALALHAPAPTQPSILQEPWFTDANTALSSTGPAPALHMVLNLDRIVPLAYFRSYWVQQNISEMARYRAAVTDLQLDRGTFQEHRALLLKSPEAPTAQAALASLVQLLPEGVYRATATSDPAAALAAIQEKILGHGTLSSLPQTSAPDPPLDAAQSGSASNLDTRIDTPPPATEAVSDDALRQAIQTAGIDAVLTYGSGEPPATPAGLWVPLHSAVVLHAASPWKPQAIADALQQSLRGTLTTATLGIDFHPDTTADDTIYALTGPRPLSFATHANLLLLSDDRTLLLAILHNATAAPLPSQAPATILAGFNHTSQRAPFARLTSLIDATDQPPGPGTQPRPPTFFAGNIRSLSDAFRTLSSASFTEHRDHDIIRQDVIYTWHQ